MKAIVIAKVEQLRERNLYSSDVARLFARIRFVYLSDVGRLIMHVST